MKDLEKMSVKELREIAQELKVKNYWNLKKDDLIDEIRRLTPAPEKKEEKKEQKHSKRAQIEYNGKSQHICAWAREIGMNPNTLYNRIYKYGWTIEQAFETPAVKGGNKKNAEGIEK